MTCRTGINPPPKGGCLSRQMVSEEARDGLYSRSGDVEHCKETQIPMLPRLYSADRGNAIGVPAFAKSTAHLMSVDASRTM